MLNCLFTALDFKSQTKYSAYTLLELLVVMSILAILGAMSFSAFGSLQNTVKMNEYMLTLEQDVRSVQRAAMLLQRDPDEKWLYGLGIDFGDMKDDGSYTVFKWCSPFGDYGDVTTRSSLPSYKPGLDLGVTANGYLPITNGISPNVTCDISDVKSTLNVLPGYERSVKTPKATFTISDIGTGVVVKPRYVVFESVSGRTFFYDREGKLLNYDIKGKMVETPQSFTITIIPQAKVSSRTFSIGNLSGKISQTVLK